MEKSQTTRNLRSGVIKMELINKKENIFGDDIAFVEQYDFSTANMSEENRIKAITTV